MKIKPVSKKMNLTDLKASGNRQLMTLSEIFLSVQGEANEVGRPTVFIRTAECNLRCSWCFPKDTLITMADESKKAIDKLEVGDKVLSLNENTKDFEEDEILEIKNRMSEVELIEIEFEDGKVITVTENHPILTEKGWKNAGELTQKDNLVTTPEIT